jgi:hypothetical protein
MQSDYAYSEDNYALTDPTQLYGSYMEVSPLPPDEYEALLVDIRLAEPSCTTATDGLGAGMLPDQPPEAPCYNEASIGINPFMSPIPQHQQTQHPPRRPRRRGVRYEPYHSRLNTNIQREQDDQSSIMVRDPSDLVFLIVGAESDDVTGKQNGHYRTSQKNSNEELKQNQKRKSSAATSRNSRQERKLDIEELRVILRLADWMSMNDVLYCRTSIFHQL